MTTTIKTFAIMLAAAVTPTLSGVGAAELPATTREFLNARCVDCHDADTKKGGLDLTALAFDPSDANNLDRWVLIHDRVSAGEMPPKNKTQPPAEDRAGFVASLSGQLLAAYESRRQTAGRVTFRRLNRTEYEYTLQDLLASPYLAVRELLPADGEAHGFDTVSEALELSSVQMVRYLQAADMALDKAIALDRAGGMTEPRTLKKPFSEVSRFTNRNGEVRASGTAQVVLRQPNSAQTPWKLDPMTAAVDGMYRLRISCYGVFWDKDVVKPADRPHMISLHAELNKTARSLKSFDAPLDRAAVLEATVWLNAGERINVHVDSLDDRNSPISSRKRGLDYSGPGMALEWIELHGPLEAAWPPASYRSLFGDLPVEPWTAESGFREPAPAEGPAVRGKGAGRPSPMMVVSKDPAADAPRLLKSFMERAFRRPAPDGELKRYVALVNDRLKQGFTFDEAMRTGFKAILCSPDFLFFNESPGKLDDFALASRLSYFLWKSMPDETLMTLARQGSLSKPEVLREQTERLLSDPKSQRFVHDFIDQWLELRRITFTQPDKQLYPEFTTLLQDSMVAETRAFFSDMLANDLGASHLVASDFVYANAPLAELYDLPGVEGVRLRKVKLPAGNPRGGFLTQASVLKVTANGTTTSPVTRGAWVMERLLGMPVPPPPPGVGSIDPDVRGTTTIREQLDKHRSSASCAACHQKIDPPGFALESFDVMGGWRERYRSLDKGDPAEGRRIGDDPVKYKLGPAVDSSGQTVDGKPFADINEFRGLLLQDREQLARNMAGRLAVFATGAGVKFADRADLERIVAQAAKNEFGLRTLVHEVVQSALFRTK